MRMMKFPLESGGDLFAMTAEAVSNAIHEEVNARLSQIGAKEAGR